MRVSSVFVGLFAAGIFAGALRAEVSPPEAEKPFPAAGLPGNSPLDDPVESLTERQPLSAVDANRLDAKSLFMLGRLYELEGRHSEALRAYQRAVRLDPTAEPILDQIVPLAFRLDRGAEAVRYLLHVAEFDPTDPVRLRRLAMALTDQALRARPSQRNELLNKSVELYQRSREQMRAAGDNVGYLVVTLEMGRLYYLTDQMPQAADCFAEVLAGLDGKDEAVKLNSDQQRLFSGDEGAKTFRLFAKAFLEADRPQLAQQAFDRLDAIAPNPALAALNRANVLSAENKPNEALEQLDRFFASRPTDAEQQSTPYELLKQLLAASGQSSQLVDRLRKITADRPDDHHAGYALAAALAETDQADEAAELLADLLVRHPTGDGYQALARIYRTRDKSTDLAALLGVVAADRGGLQSLGDETAAIIADEGLIDRLGAAAREMNADDGAPEYGPSAAVAELALEAGKFDLAKELFDRALKARPDAANDLFSLWGMGLIMADQYTAAAAVFQRAIDEGAVAADDFSMHYYLSAALEMDGRTDEALVAARTAAERAGGAPRIQNRIGWVLFHARRYDEALAAYQQIVDQFSGDYSSEEIREALKEARLMLSSINVEQGNIAAAEEWLAQVLDEFPGDISASNDLGYLWADQNKNLEQALEMIQRAVADEPENAAYRDSQGWVLYRLGRYDEAIAALEAAVGARDDADGVILDHLGDAYQAAGRADDAQAAWRRAVAAFEKDGRQAELLEATRKKLTEHAGEPAAPDGR